MQKEKWLQYSTITLTVKTHSKQKGKVVRTTPDLPAKDKHSRQGMVCTMFTCYLRVLIKEKWCEEFLRVNADYTITGGNGAVRLLAG